MGDGEGTDRPTASNGSRRSCLSTSDHPARIKRAQDGKQSLTFNERVTVHSVPPYDPSRFSYVQEFEPEPDSRRGARTCCIIS